MLPAIGIAIFTLFWFFDQIFNGYLFCFMDLTRYFYPYRQFMVEALRSFSLPMWNPYIYNGFPFFASLQTGLCYPLSIIYFILPFDQAFNWFLIIHYPLAFFFMYLMLRDFKLSKSAAIIGGLSFAFSGYMNSVLHMPTSLSSVIWLPLVVMFWRRVSLVPLSIILGIMFLGGEPTILYATILFLGGYSIVRLFYDKDIQLFLKHLAVLFSSIVFSFCLTAVQLFPFIELVMHSVRSKGLGFVEASHWSLAPRDLISFVIPYFFNLTPFPYVNTDWLKVPYLGTVALFLALVAIAYRIRAERRIQILTIGFAASVIIAMGKFTPIYQFLYSFLPGFSLTRYPVKFLFLTTFIVSFLAAIGLDLIVNEKLNQKVPKIFIGLSILFAAISSIMFFNIPVLTSILKPFFQNEINIGFYKYLPGIMERNIINVLICCFFVFIISIIVLLKEKMNPKLFAICIIVLAASDLYLSNREAVLSIPMADYHKIPKNIEMLQRDHEKFRVYTSPAMSSRSQTEIASEFFNYSDALFSMRDRIPANQNMLYKIDLVEAYESIKGADQDDLINKLNNLNSLDHVRILDVMNVKYLVSPWPINFKGYQLISREKEKIKEGYIYLYKNNNYLPRAFVVPNVKVMPKEKMLEYMASKEFKPEKEVLMDEFPGVIPAKAGIQIWMPHQVRHDTTIISYKPNEVVVSAESSGILFLSDSYYPGWRAFVDGKETKIYRANFMFRAVVLNAGRHVVRFVYDPISFRAGLIVSSISFIVLLVVFMRRRKR